MNVRKWGMAALAVVMGVSLGGCKKKDETPKISETEQLRRYNEQRFNDLQASVTQLSDQVEKGQSLSSGGAQITDIGGPVVIEQARPRPSRREQIREASDVPPSGERSTGRSSANKTVVASGVSVRDVQRALARAGFNPGKADGVAGAQTVKAIKQFQAAEGLKADGVVGARTWDRLRKHQR